MVSQNFEAYSARALADGLQSNRWTSVELTRHFLARIKVQNPEIHAVPFLFEEEALAEAKASDVRRSTGKPLSILDGIPMTIKDAIRMKDSPSTYGIWILRNHRPRTDSKLVEVLRSSGIVFLGRTAVPTGAFDWNCRNSLYAECVNPFDPTRTPGGSSGGAAAALATGMTPLELGSDLGGSIRYPAHCCGVFGLRTTDGWLPIADSGPENFPSSFTQLATFGPMARHLGDLDLLLERYSENFPGQKTPANSSKDHLKIAYSKSLLGVSANADTRKLFEEMLERLSKQGHELVETSPYPDFEELYRVWGIIAGHEYTHALPAAIRNRFLLEVFAWWILDHRLGKGPITTNFKRGIFAGDTLYREACEKRKKILQTVDRFFENFQLWILPVAPSPAIPLSLSGRMIPTENGPMEYSRYLGSYTVPTTTLGTPVLTYPIGKDATGLPIGIQMHGPRFADRWLIRIVSELKL